MAYRLVRSLVYKRGVGIKELLTLTLPLTLTLTLTLTPTRREHHHQHELGLPRDILHPLEVVIVER